MFFDKIFNNKQSHADIYIRASKLIDEAQILSNVINTTTSENEFFASYDRLTNILLELKSYERKIKFSNKPSDDLRNIRKNKSKAIERFNARKNAVPILLDNPDPHFRDAAVLIIKSDKGSVPPQILILQNQCPLLSFTCMVVCMLFSMDLMLTISMLISSMQIPEKSLAPQIHLIWRLAIPKISK